MTEESFGNMGQVDENDAGGSSYQALPEGVYPVYIADYKLKPTRPGTPQQGLQCVITMQVAEGEYADKKVIEGFNVRNQNADTVRISLAKLKTLTIATGQNGNVDLTETIMRNWFQKLVYVDLKIRPGNAQYPEPRNSVVKFVSETDVIGYQQQNQPAAAATPPPAHPAPPAAPPAAPPPQAPAAGGAPWQQQAAAPAAPQAPVAPTAT